MSGRRVRRSDGVTTRADLLMLQQVADENVTWRSDLAGRVSYRLWSDDEHYTTVTPRLRRLADRGLTIAFHGWQHGRGGVELSPSGRDRVDRSNLNPLP